MSFDRNTLIRLLFFALLFAILTGLNSSVFASCEVEPKLSDADEPIKTLEFVTRETTEVALSIRASVPNASWGKTGAEAAVLTVFIDGEYNQDVIIFAGAATFEYKMLLGRIGSGTHDIKITFNKKRSAAGATSINVGEVKVTPLVAKSVAERFALENSPVIYARANAIDRFTDIPLVTYYERLFKPDGSNGIRYTTIFSNEDGGTQTTALLARWGRATDIEWVYETWFRDGKRINEIFQGANHQTTDFRGTRVLGDHPLINTITDNNNFADTGCSRLRFAPLPQAADLSKKSRETVMDSNPWTYRIMAEEAMREGRVNPANLGPNVIDDLRNYLFVEAFSDAKGQSVAVEVATGDGKTARSDNGDASLRVSRPGYQRIAVRLPPSSTVIGIRLICFEAQRPTEQGTCGASHIVKSMRLDRVFSPRVFRLGQESLVHRKY